MERKAAKADSGPEKCIHPTDWPKFMRKDDVIWDFLPYILPPVQIDRTYEHDKWWQTTTDSTDSTRSLVSRCCQELRKRSRREPRRSGTQLFSVLEFCYHFQRIGGKWKLWKRSDNMFMNVYDGLLMIFVWSWYNDADQITEHATQIRYYIRFACNIVHWTIQHASRSFRVFSFSFAFVHISLTTEGSFQQMFGSFKSVAGRRPQVPVTPKIYQWNTNELKCTYLGTCKFGTLSKAQKLPHHMRQL